MFRERHKTLLSSPNEYLQIDTEIQVGSILAFKGGEEDFEKKCAYRSRSSG